jgi:hypothetical protein
LVLVLVSVPVMGYWKCISWSTISIAYGLFDRGKTQRTDLQMISEQRVSKRPDCYWFVLLMLQPSARHAPSANSPCDPLPSADEEQVARSRRWLALTGFHLRSVLRSNLSKYWWKPLKEVGDTTESLTPHSSAEKSAFWSNAKRRSEFSQTHRSEDFIRYLGFPVGT